MILWFSGVSGYSYTGHLVDKSNIFWQREERRFLFFADRGRNNLSSFFKGFSSQALGNGNMQMRVALRLLQWEGKNVAHLLGKWTRQVREPVKESDSKVCSSCCLSKVRMQIAWPQRKGPALSSVMVTILMPWETHNWHVQVKNCNRLFEYPIIL